MHWLLEFSLINSRINRLECELHRSTGTRTMRTTPPSVSAVEFCEERSVFAESRACSVPEPNALLLKSPSSPPSLCFSFSINGCCFFNEGERVPLLLGGFGARWMELISFAEACSCCAAAAGWVFVWVVSRNGYESLSEYTYCDVLQRPHAASYLLSLSHHVQRGLTETLLHRYIVNSLFCAYGHKQKLLKYERAEASDLLFADSLPTTAPTFIQQYVFTI